MRTISVDLRERILGAYDQEEGTLALNCSVQAIHVVLARMGLTYKKRRSAPASRTGRTSPGHARSGSEGRAAWIRRG